jgi:hypothetical protein
MVILRDIASSFACSIHITARTDRPGTGLQPKRSDILVMLAEGVVSCVAISGRRRKWPMGSNRR